MGKYSRNVVSIEIIDEIYENAFEFNQMNRFLNKMIRKIRQKAEKYQHGWAKCSIKQLESRLNTEIEEWKSLTKPEQYSDKELDELIDIANQAMLLWIRKNHLIKTGIEEL